ncbi:MAG: hypothetical protein P4L59_12430 [Desulfosporosinus sp.]|nr:hypothetical protein [Desulfosporosinus sp.]
MVQRIVKLLGISAPILLLILAYPIWFAFKNLDDPDSTLFWLMFLFVSSIVGAFGAWKKIKQLVWVVAKIFLIDSVVWARNIGLLVVPLPLLFVAISILLYLSDKNVLDSWNKFVSFIEGEFRTKKTEISGWVGYLIVITSIWTDGIIRYYNDHANPIWFYVIYFTVAIGAIISLSSWKKSKYNMTK